MVWSGAYANDEAVVITASSALSLVSRIAFVVKTVVSTFGKFAMEEAKSLPNPIALSLHPLTCNAIKRLALALAIGLEGGQAPLDGVEHVAKRDADAAVREEGGRLSDHFDRLHL